MGDGGFENVGRSFTLANGSMKACAKRSFAKVRGQRGKTLGLISLALGVTLILTTHTFAGPPFLTDDPEPTDYQHWENYLFTSGDHTGGGYTIDGPAAEVDYGAFPDTQLSLIVPVTSVGGNTPHHTGLGDVDLSVKYRFVHETNSWPQIAFFPAVVLPTGNAVHGLGNGRVLFRLPLWLQKSWGPWTTYGGGGATLNSAPGKRDFGFAGWLLQRDLGEHLILGGEFYAQGRDADDDRGFVAFNFGGSYKLTDHFSLLASAGHSIAGQVHTFWYFALGWSL